MGLPETVVVKLSSEDAGAIALTPVVVQEIPPRELIERILGVTGKDPERIAQLLVRGSLVIGGTRFRWPGWDAAPGEIAALLAEFPDSEPDRRFSPEHAASAALVGLRGRIEIAREDGERRRFLRRRSFWQALMELTLGAALEYVEYSYEHRADCYRQELEPARREKLRAAAAALKGPTFAAQVRAAGVTAIEYYVARPAQRASQPPSTTSTCPLM
jgi:hypothetical protein